ncbi:MAG: imidazoleglycerol-phosphate dehydratase HisB [Sphaerochaetaceae bacterium]
MTEKNDKGAALFIEIFGGILTLKDGMPYFCLDVFPSLIALSEDNRYQLYLIKQKETEESLADYVVSSLTNQKIVIEDVVEESIEPSFVAKEFSYLIGPNTKQLETLWGIRALSLDSWQERVEFLLEDYVKNRKAFIKRETAETSIELKLDLDGKGKGAINSGLPFFDHMLLQIARHGKIDLELTCKGDLEVDEHHSVEDIAIVLGQAFQKALGEKRGLRRYGFEVLPMDEVLATVVVDFSGRSHFEWDVRFGLPMVGTFPTELFSHFFKTFSDHCRCNLNISVTDGNTHHQIEALFKAFARALRKAVFRYKQSDELPSTKGVL